MSLFRSRRLLRASSLALLACSLTAPLAGAPPPVSPPSPVTPPSPAVSDGPVYDPFTSATLALQSAAEVAAAKNVRILVNFGTNDCEPCVTFSKAIHEDPTFEVALRDQLVTVWIDAIPGSENEKVFKGYGLDRSKGLPAVAILDIAMRTSTIFKNGEAAEAARKGTAAVRDFLLKQFVEKQQ